MHATPLLHEIERIGAFGRIEPALPDAGRIIAAANKLFSGELSQVQLAALPDPRGNCTHLVAYSVNARLSDDDRRAEARRGLGLLLAPPEDVRGAQTRHVRIREGLVSKGPAGDINHTLVLPEGELIGSRRARVTQQAHQWERESTIVGADISCWKIRRAEGERIIGWEAINTSSMTQKDLNVLRYFLLPADKFTLNGRVTPCAVDTVDGLLLLKALRRAKFNSQHAVTSENLLAASPNGKGDSDPALV